MSVIDLLIVVFTGPAGNLTTLISMAEAAVTVTTGLLVKSGLIWPNEQKKRTNWGKKELFEKYLEG